MRPSLSFAPRRSATSSTRSPSRPTSAAIARISRSIGSRSAASSPSSSCVRTFAAAFLSRWHIVPPASAPMIPEQPYAVLLHATSRGEKLWPEAHWRALVAHFARAGYATVLPWGSPDEESRSHRIAEGNDGTIVPPWLSL